MRSGRVGGVGCARGKCRCGGACAVARVRLRVCGGVCAVARVRLRVCGGVCAVARVRGGYADSVREVALCSLRALTPPLRRRRSLSPVFGGVDGP